MSLPQAFLVFSFFFKHKTAYELLISDWCSDVCSSDLYPSNHQLGRAAHPGRCRARRGRKGTPEHRPPVQPRRRPTEDRPAKPASTARAPAEPPRRRRSQDRKSVVEGKRVSVRVDLGGRRILKTKKIKQHTQQHAHKIMTNQ